MEKGIRLTLDAEEQIKKSDVQDEIVDELLTLNKPLISKEDVESILNKKITSPIVDIKSATNFLPLAKEWDTDIKINHTRDVTGKSRGKGELDDFVSYFRNRYERLARLLRTGSKYPNADLKDIKRYVNERVRVIVTISEKRETQKGNTLFEIEDLTGAFKAVVSANKFSKEKELAFEKAKQVLLDDVVAVSGKVLEPYIIVDDIEWPDLPVLRERKLIEKDLAIAYISDMHFGSRYFLDHYLEAFLDWLHGKGEERELASKVKYIVVAGDIVDGIGVYPNQEKELVVKDIYQQYKMFDDFMERVPDYIKVIMAPGNHDAVRRGEPMPAVPKDLIKSDEVIRIGNPSCVAIEGLKHLVYHGTSMDSLIAALPNASYNHPEKVMVEYLKRRHLSPIYGGNLIIPEKVDYFVIEDEPDVLHCGHVHKNGYALYRGTLVINSGTFQDRTEYQIKQGHVPTPAIVPVYEAKYGRLKSIDFKTS